MRLPEIGDTITTEKALELCKYFQLDYLVKRIKANPEAYKEWIFDGCSMIPDELMGLLVRADGKRMDWEDITFKCCFPHDLEHAYGKKGSKIERELSNDNFENNLTNKAGMKPFLAGVFRKAVELGGKEEFGFNFTWAFASK